MTQSPSPIEPQPKRPTWRAFVVVLGVAMTIGFIGIFQLTALQEANTTSKEDGNYVAGDCRIYERTLPGRNYNKVHKARMCLHEDGTWVVEESSTERVRVPSN